MSIKNLFKSAFGLSLCAISGLSSIPEATAVTIYGSVIYSGDSGDPRVGIHSFDTSSASSLTPVAGGEDVLAQGGRCVCRRLLLCDKPQRPHNECL